MLARIIVVLAVLLGSMVVSPQLARADVSGPVIAELQTGGAANAEQEFVELANPTATAVELTGWSLQYRASSEANGADCTKGWTSKLALPAGTLPANGTFLFAATGYLAPDASFSPGLAADGGAVRLVDAAGVSITALAWGNGSCGAGPVAPMPGAGQSLSRGADSTYAIQAVPTPQASGVTAVGGKGGDAPAPTVAANVDHVDPVASPTAPDSLSGLRISELLPDPASPLTDARDEYIELYNTSDSAIDLAGYVLRAGKSLGGQYSIKEGRLEPDSYRAFTSGDTKLSLVNTGGSAALYDPSGRQIGEIVTYPKATAGQAWTYVDESWQWTTSPTPGGLNIAAAPVLAAATAKTATAAKVVSAKAVAAARPKATPRPKVTPKPKTVSTAPKLAATTAPGGYWLLFALAGLTIGYIMYEFRYDVRNLYFRLRGHTGASRATVPAPLGRGDH